MLGHRRTRAHILLRSSPNFIVALPALGGFEVSELHLVGSDNQVRESFRLSPA